MNHAFVFPGGGFKSAGQVGFANRMLEMGVRPAIIGGTSGGTLVGAMVAMGKHKELNEIYTEVGRTNGTNIFAPYLVKLSNGSVSPDLNNLKKVLLDNVSLWNKIGLVSASGRKHFLSEVIENIQNVNHLIDNSPLYEILLKHIRRADFQCAFRFTLVSLYDQLLYTLSQDSFASDEDFAKAILASASIPGLCQPVKEIKLTDGTVIFDAADGGLRSSSPIPQVIAAITQQRLTEPWQVVVMNSNVIEPGINKTRKNLLTQIGSAIDILLNEGLQRDIKYTQKLNRLALAAPGLLLSEGVQYVELLNLEVPKDGSMGGTLDASADIIAKRIQIGYELAESVSSGFHENPVNQTTVYKA